MWARVTTSQVDPAKLEEEKRIFEEEVVPVSKDIKGFQGALSLRDSSTGKVIVVTLWETKEDMLDSEESGFWKEQVDHFTAIMTGPPQKDHYEVSSMIALTSGITTGT